MSSLDLEHEEPPTVPATRPTHPPTYPPEPEPAPEQPDCTAFDYECNRLTCPYGVLKSYDPSGCTRCQCDDPCQDYSCPRDTQCSVDIDRNRDGETVFVPVCRRVHKAGYCPRLPENGTCITECYSDADCRGEYKCCAAGCSQVCVLPYSEPEPVTRPPVPGVRAPVLQEVPQDEVDVEISEGGVATLKCYATGFPPPTITWRHRGIVVSILGHILIIKVFHYNYYIRSTQTKEDLCYHQVEICKLFKYIAPILVFMFALPIMDMDKLQNVKSN
jgi:hypothetical protein